MLMNKYYLCDNVLICCKKFTSDKKQSIIFIDSKTDGLKFSFIILDEVFKNCNQKTTEKLFNILNKIDYITTFIISHRELGADNIFELKDQKITKL